LGNAVSSEVAGDSPMPGGGSAGSESSNDGIPFVVVVQAGEPAMLMSGTVGPASTFMPKDAGSKSTAWFNYFIVDEYESRMRSLHNGNVVSMMEVVATDAVSRCITGRHIPYGHHTCRYVRQFEIIHAANQGPLRYQWCYQVRETEAI
jgi:hypothetical protein